MKPVIGITPLVDEKLDSLWMLPEYMDSILEAGGTAVMLPLTDDEAVLRTLAERLDGILFTGGQDVSPWVYHTEKLEGKCFCFEARDRMELALLKIAMERDLPVLGICRGLQFINAALGGTLYQDLPTEHPSEIGHDMEPPYDRAAHSVELPNGTPLQILLGKERAEVNSRHHQAIRKLAPGLEAMATAPDGVTEAFHMPGKRFFWAVQWHPEHSIRTSEDSRKLMRAFVQAAVKE